MSRLTDRARPDGGKSNDLGAVALMPFVKSSAVFRDDFLKNMRRDNEVDFNRVDRLDCDVILADFDIWRHLTKITWSHLSTPLRFVTTERFGIEHAGKPRVQRLNELTKILIDERLGDSV